VKSTTERRGTIYKCTDKWKKNTNEKSTSTLARYRFYFVFQMKKTNKTSSFQEFQTKVWDQDTLKKAKRDVFILGKWHLIVKKQALLDDCALIQAFKYIILKVLKHSPVIKEYINLAKSDNFLKKSGIFSTNQKFFKSCSVGEAIAQW